MHWKEVLHRGLFPLVSDTSLEALRQALASNSPRLIQGANMRPSPWYTVQDHPVEAACAIGICGWIGDGLETVGELEEYIGRLIFKVDERLGEPAGVRHFLNPYDGWSREEMIDNLLPEVDAAIAGRLNGTAEVAPEAHVSIPAELPSEPPW